MESSQKSFRIRMWHCGSNQYKHMSQEAKTKKKQKKIEYTNNYHDSRRLHKQFALCYVKYKSE